MLKITTIQNSKQLKSTTILSEQEKIKGIAIETLDIEAQAIEKLKSFINDDFIRCVELILKSPGRIIISGIGKSAIIANKIVATMNSTGSPAVFMHAADAIHGDLGIIQPQDIVICISKSGDTPEIKALVPLLKVWNNPFIAMVGNMNSYLAKEADIVLNTTVDKEACPNNLAPTSSSTAQLAMGDALAMCLLKMKGFTSKDFAKYHPGGALGKRLYLKVDDIYKNNAAPKVLADADMRTIILEISSKRLGATAVVDADNKLLGVITDGDLRRMLEKNIDSITNLKASEIMTKNPKSAESELMAVEAMELMKQYNINQLVVVKNGQYLGIVHIHDLIKEGIN